MALYLSSPDATKLRHLKKLMMEEEDPFSDIRKAGATPADDGGCDEEAQNLGAQTGGAGKRRLSNNSVNLVEAVDLQTFRPRLTPDDHLVHQEPSPERPERKEIHHETAGEAGGRASAQSREERSESILRQMQEKLQEEVRSGIDRGPHPRRPDGGRVCLR